MIINADEYEEEWMDDLDLTEQEEIQREKDREAGRGEFDDA